MEAYLIETLRNHGVSDDALISQVADGDISNWENLDTSFDFKGLIDLYKQDEQVYQSIIQDGYQVKFVTFGGLKNLLKLKFNKIADKDYTTLETGITGLKVTADELEELQQLLSQNWTINELNVDDAQVREISIQLG